MTAWSEICSASSTPPTSATPRRTAQRSAGSLTTATLDAGDSWSNLDWAEEAKSEAEQVHTMLTEFVANPATALALAELKEQTGSNKSLLGPRPDTGINRVIGVPLYVSPSVANNTLWGIPQPHSIFVLHQRSLSGHRHVGLLHGGRVRWRAR